jgi:hypothetical protein
MRKKSFVRFQIFLIMVLVGLVIWRMNEGPEKGDGFISLVDMKVGLFGHLRLLGVRGAPVKWFA